jgi:hypothetical protein
MQRHKKEHYEKCIHQLPVSRRSTRALVWLLSICLRAPVKSQDPRVGQLWHFCVVIFLKTLRAALRWWGGGVAVLRVASLVR